MNGTDTDTRVAAVIYAAKSSEDRHGSIPTQLQDCRALAEREGWQVVGEYSDEAFSAYHGNRGPGLEQAKAAAIAAGPCVLVAQDVDRFARGAGDEPGAADHLGEMFFAMRRQRVTLWSCRTGEVDSLRAVMEGERSHSESERKSQAVTSGLLRRARDRHKPAGGPAPYGYRWRAWLGENGQRVSELEVVPADARVIERIFSDAVAGVSQMAITRNLNREGIRCPRGKGKKWTQATVNHILRRHVYYGKVTHNGKLYDGMHHSIISEETWRAAERLRNTQARSKNNGGGRQPKGNHLLTRGLLRCGTCGGAMHVQTKKRANGSRYEFYECISRHRDIESCPQLPVAREAIDDAILAEFTERHLSLEATRSRRRAKREEDAALASRARADAESDLARAEASLARVRSDYTSGEITAAEWRDLRGELEAERDAAVAAVERVRAQAEVAADDEADDEAQVLRRLSQLRDLALGRLDSAPDLDATRTLLRQIFERVILVNVNGAAKLYPVPDSEQFVVADFYAEHGRLPEPEEYPGRLDEMKRVPLPLALSEAGPKSLV